MAEHAFSSAEEAAKFLLARRGEITSGLARAIATEVVTTFQSGPDLPGTQSWQIGPFVVRDEDVDLFDAVASAAPSAIAAYTAVPADAYKHAVAAVVASSVAALKLLRSVVRNYAELSQAERVLISVLKMSPGQAMAESRLIEALTQKSPEIFATKEAVLTCLEGLKEKAVHSGAVKPVVVVDGQRVWRCAV